MSNKIEDQNMTFFIVRNLNRDGRPEVKRFSDVDLQEIFMSRLFDLTRIIGGLVVGNEEKNYREWFLKMIFEGFEPAFVALCELKKAENNNDYPENKIEKHVKDMISYLVIAYKDRMQKVAESFGYNIGFLYGKDVNFEQGARKFINEHNNIDKNIINLMRDNRAKWQKTLIRIRNVLINHQMTASIKEIEELKSYLNHLKYSECNNLFDNCWKAAEDILFILMRDFIKIGAGTNLRETKDYQKNPQSKVRFGWYITVKN